MLCHHPPPLRSRDGKQRRWYLATQLTQVPRAHLDNIRRHAGPFTDLDVFDGSDEGAQALERMKLLLVKPTPSFDTQMLTPSSQCYVSCLEDDCTGRPKC